MAIQTERTEGWEARLLAALAEISQWRYQVGVHDCVAMVCRVIEALTGASPWPRWAGQYTDPCGARKAIRREAGFKKPYLANAVTNVLQVEPLPPLQARRGDVVELDDAGEPHIGVALHTEAVSFGPNGIFYWPLAKCNRCWRVG